MRRASIAARTTFLSSEPASPSETTESVSCPSRCKSSISSCGRFSSSLNLICRELGACFLRAPVRPHKRGQPQYALVVGSGSCEGFLPSNFLRRGYQESRLLESGSQSHTALRRRYSDYLRKAHARRSYFYFIEGKCYKPILNALYHGFEAGPTLYRALLYTVDRARSIYVVSYGTALYPRDRPGQLRNPGLWL